MGACALSILHSAGDDPHGYERASERWSPVHTVGSQRAVVHTSSRVCCRATRQHSEPAPAAQVETIMISIISMLSSPNDESPANIDAAKEWRENREGFKRHVARIVRKSQEML